MMENKRTMKEAYQPLTEELIEELLKKPVVYENNLTGKRLEICKQIKLFYSGIVEPHFLIDYEFLMYPVHVIGEPQCSEVIPVTYSALKDYLKKLTSTWYYGHAESLVQLTSLCSPCLLPRAFQHQVVENLETYSWNYPEELTIEEIQDWRKNEFMILEWESMFG